MNSKFVARFLFCNDEVAHFSLLPPIYFCSEMRIYSIVIQRCLQNAENCPSKIKSKENFYSGELAQYMSVHVWIKERVAEKCFEVPCFKTY